MYKNINLDHNLVKELSYLERTIKVLSSINKNDYAVSLEQIMIPIFNIFFDTNFTDLNKESKNFPGVDIYSEEKQIAIQITVNTKPEKKRRCINSVSKLVTNNVLKINQLYIFVLTSSKHRVKLEETEFFNKNNVLNIESLINCNDEIKFDMLEALDNELKNNFSATYIKNLHFVRDLFVETEVYRKALKQLEKNHSIILNGNAGTGKSLTSYKIVFDYIEQGYQFINDFSEIKNINNSKIKYIIFKDDVIASTDLANVDYRKIQQDFDNFDIANENIKVIFNSRTNIINTYGTSNSRFDINKYKKYFINVEELTKVEKFRILKNHIQDTCEKEELMTLFNNDKLELTSRDKIFKIINHEKFNPRIIEFCRNNIENIKDNLADNIIDTLNNPDKIYFEQYDKLSELEKNILKYTSICNENINHENLKAYFLMNGYNKYEIERAISNLSDCFLIQSKYDYELLFEFFNPSIRDFIESILEDDQKLDEYFNTGLSVDGILNLLRYENIDSQKK